MQNILLFIASIPFLLINYKIVENDIKEKKIPNKYLKYLLFLLPFWWILIYLLPVPYLDTSTLLIFFLQIILTLIISFTLYSFGIWSAGDAKYLLILALFIPNIGIIPFLGNIALIILLYLFLYFLWFYFGKCLFDWKYTKSLYLNIYNDLKDKAITFLKDGDGNFYKKMIFLKILKWILLFLIIFVSIRLARLYIFADIRGSIYYENLLDYLNNYSYYIILTLILIFILSLYLIKLAINKLKIFISKRSKIKNNLIIDYILISILLVGLISFIIYEYTINPNEVIDYLIKIFTIYIFLYLFSKILFYSYKITFSIAETYYIGINNLKEGDIVDKEYLIKMFGEQSSLGAYGDKGILSPNPAEYFKNIENPIDKEIIKKLKKIYKIVNIFHKNNNGTPENNNIKILKTFAFGGYIFAGFIISFLFGNIIIQYLISILLKIIKS